MNQPFNSFDVYLRNPVLFARFFLSFALGTLFCKRRGLVHELSLPKTLIRDNDAIYGGVFKNKFEVY